MKKISFVVIATALSVSTLGAASASAQGIVPIGMNPFGVPMCMGSMGPGTCADIIAWAQRGGNMGMNPGFPGGPVFQPQFPQAPVFHPNPAPAPVQNNGGGGGGGVKLPTIDDVAKTVGVIATVASFF